MNMQIKSGAEKYHRSIEANNIVTNPVLIGLLFCINQIQILDLLSN